MNTGSSPKTISSAYPLNLKLRLAAEIIILMGIGAIGVLLHAKFRMPLGIPGRYGLVYMALLIAGKLVTQRSYAASVASLGAAFMLLAPLGYKDPFMPLMYILPGFIVDLGFRLGNAWRTKLVLIAVICGAAYMTLPLSRMIITVTTGFPYESFMKWGIPAATGMHLLFGFAGGLAGAALVRVFKPKRKV
jgi:hypothetical protein